MTNWQKTLDENILDWRDVTAAELPTHLYEWLKKACWETRNKKLDSLKMNSNLVGHIKEEYRITNWPREFEEFITKASVSGPTRRWYDRFEFNTEDRPIVFENLWCNFQKKHEFNPPHGHSGVVSFVIFVSIPYDLEEEDKMYPDIKVDEKTQKVTSRFQLLNTDTRGNITTDAIDVDKSFEGKMFIFPNVQIHQVFPFYTSDQYRITVSGNLRYRV